MIKKGDLVMVVGPTECCGNGFRIGQVFTVSTVYSDTRRCAHCKTVLEEVPLAFNHKWGFSFSRLRKIDPPSEGETREAYVNLKQPRKVTA